MYTRKKHVFNNVLLKKKKKKSVGSTSASSVEQDQQGSFNGSTAAAGVQQQVPQQQQLHSHRSPVPAATPNNVMTFSSAHAAYSRPNSHKGEDAPQALPCQVLASHDLALLHMSLNRALHCQVLAFLYQAPHYCLLTSPNLDLWHWVQASLDQAHQ